MHGDVAVDGEPPRGELVGHDQKHISATPVHEPRNLAARAPPAGLDRIATTFKYEPNTGEGEHGLAG